MAPIAVPSTPQGPFTPAVDNANGPKTFTKSATAASTYHPLDDLTADEVRGTMCMHATYICHTHSSDSDHIVILDDTRFPLSLSLCVSIV